MVIANLLQTRKTEVVAVTRETADELKLNAHDIEEGTEIEEKIVAELKRCHGECRKL
jgi:hypothetical protein